MTDSAPGQASAVERRPGKRDRLVVAAMQLLHQQGAERTTLADIAQVAEVPVGNVYYYFKTKNDVIAAVIDSHAQQVTTMLARIDARHRSPKGRLKALVREFTAEGDMVAQFGCPLGGLCSELDRGTTHPDLAPGQLMRLPIDWAEAQFRSMGRRDAHDLAVHLLAIYEGSALLANALRDPDVLAGAARRLARWIDSL